MMDYNQYINQNAEYKVTKSDLNKVAFRTMLINASFNFERMQAIGFTYAISPIVNKVHTNPEDKAMSLKNHLNFINCHTYVISLILGITAAMEEKKESPELIQNLKVSLMGPLAGLGDSLIWFTIMPILAGIGVSFAMDGNVFGPIFFVLTFNIVENLVRFGFVHYGYKLGVGIIDKIKDISVKVIRSASILGMTVIGALIASYVSLSTSMTITAGQAEINLQTDLFDAIMPNLLPLLYTLFMFYLIRKKKVSPIVLILITIVISLVGVFFKIL
ncbi:MAG: PTS system mannose/fructose/sorbose family transporter subunit IID [Anaerorhabdus sp.]|uniref:PTS system mannose/fructose/sorbose family transporter subunit IID n=2 Tax=Anaerorhabdus sp. TaxID=1872524 RepID=UPI002B3FE618|nr:PTS system mannose/fructose/sorbose family transporter subunit IID [Anaerorhabdus sp.]